ncbi:DUF4917 family protein [Halalkalibaculum sp. DA384]|uniref:DUF4917 family protein n=1 Tax=Halalkalibaculum sp. DA384 TaxID=3373606 RepID=UPI003754D596
MGTRTYNEVLEYLDSTDRDIHLLLGNGFSMAYDPDIFSYNALHKFIEQIDDELLSKLFDIVNTKDFELVMQQLDNFNELIELFGSDKKLKTHTTRAIQRLQESLLEAIQDLHPEHVFKISEDESKSAADFLSFYTNHNGNVFTTNYDLLLYWVLMRNSIANSTDGFGRDLLNPEDEYIPEDELEYSKLRWGKNKENQNIHYVHGTLPFFDTGIHIEKEEYTTTRYLLENVKARLDRKEYPIFVTAGSGKEKLTHILHNRYLTYCYESLCNISGSLVTFGFNFGENDKHIIDAINKASKQGKQVPPRLWSVYIGTYSDEDRRHIESIREDFKCKVTIWDAKTAKVWR